ncbi:MAG: anthranilate synthase component 2 [Cyclobacteriaceae bacterium]|jgi:anthranilate synthase component 2
MKILVLDNYDSFTYNLVHIIRELGFAEELDVFRNDKISINDVGSYDHILLSPGPGLPKDAGIMPELLKKYASTKNILGVCLGHQAIAESFGGDLYNLTSVFHGIATKNILTNEDPFFTNIPKEFQVCRYHSWAVKGENLPEELSITAVDESGSIMAIRHKEFNVRGVQFHPESIMTEHGKQMIKNWLAIQV